MREIMLTELEVADMMAAAREGDRDSLGQVLEVFRHYLLAVAKREMDLGLSAKAGPSDLVQETLLEAQRDFDHFSGTSESDIQAWLRRLLLNNLANFRRHYRDCAKRCHTDFRLRRSQARRQAGLKTCGGRDVLRTAYVFSRCADCKSNATRIWLSIS